jgi:hypothetical protein
MNGEQACAERKPLIFAVDQRPFQIPTASGHINRFCLLQAIMTLDGKRIPPGRESFPNRGRVWWMLRDDIPYEMVVPGSVWYGPIERGTRIERSRPDIDFFQASAREIQPSWGTGSDLVEVLHLPGTDPDLALVQRELPIPWPRPTTARVILFGPTTVLGPLRAHWRADTQQLTVSALSTAQPEVLRLPATQFIQATRVEPFTLTLHEYDALAEERKCSIMLTRMSWLDLERLRSAGEVLDASTDAQIITWAQRFHNLTRTQIEPLQDLLANVSRGVLSPGANGDALRLARFQRLLSEAGRIVDLGAEVARGLAETPAFADLVGRHVEGIAQERIADAIRQKHGEIDAALEDKRRALQQVQADLDQLIARYDHRAAEEEEELRKRRAAIIETLERREREVMLLEQRLKKREDEVTARLEPIIKRYQEQAERVSEELLAQLPFLHRLGLGTSVSAPVPLSLTSPSPVPAPAELTLPEFLYHPRNLSGGPPLTESEFLTQLGRVVEERGFVFPEEELINFHVCLKIGGLTVLAGLSGTGKSSLPRLYAEALGCHDEYLALAVRPDWLDDRDLIGAFNALAQRFEPAVCGLVEHLIAAEYDRQHSRGGIYLICLDEMNLARVEHYFAQFLSVLEQPPESRCLSLFAPGLARSDDPYAPYQRLRLGDNVRFLGTVNIDETTHFFSPKVLDRCQVVAFGAPDLTALRRSRPVETVHGLRPVLLSDYLAWTRPPAESSSARTFLLAVNEILRGSRLGLGFRPFDRVLRYVESAQPFFSEDVALDFQLKQVLLPRLRSTAPGFAETVQKLAATVPHLRFPRSADVLTRILDARAEDDYFQIV